MSHTHLISVFLCQIGYGHPRPAITFQHLCVFVSLFFLPLSFDFGVFVYCLSGCVCLFWTDNLPDLPAKTLFWTSPFSALESLLGPGHYITCTEIWQYGSLMLFRKSVAITYLDHQRVFRQTSNPKILFKSKETKKIFTLKQRNRSLKLVLKLIGDN